VANLPLHWQRLPRFVRIVLQAMFSSDIIFTFAYFLRGGHFPFLRGPKLHPRFLAILQTLLVVFGEQVSQKEEAGSFKPFFKNLLPASK